MARNPKGHIQLHTHQAPVRILADDSLVAKTDRALILQEKGHPARCYIPREDVAMEKLTPSGKVTHCPYKGEATYYHVEADGNLLENAAWSYQTPFTAMRDISDHLAFDHAALTESQTE